MNTERDPRMASLLRSENPPDHRRGFWDDVRDDLDDVVDKPMGRVIDMNRFRRRAPMVAVAAVAVVVAVIAGFGLLDRGDDGNVDVDVASPTQTGPEGTDVTEAPSGDLGPLVAGEPVERGSGRVLGVSADGRWLYVADAAGDREMACEGVPRAALFVEPVAGGERRLAAPAESFNATTVSSIHFDGAGRAAAVDQCEGFDASIITATIAEDGTLVDMEELTIPEPDCHEGPVDGIADISYVAPGQLVAATMSLGDGEASCQHLFSLPDSASEPTLLSDEPVAMVEATPDGRLVTATYNGSVAVDGEDVYGVGESGIYDLAISPSGAVVAVSGGAADAIVPLDGSPPSEFASDAYEVAMVDDANGVMTADVGEQRVLATFHSGDEPMTLVEGNISAFVVTPTGDRVFVTVTDDMGENPQILQVSLSR